MALCPHIFKPMSLGYLSDIYTELGLPNCGQPGPTYVIWAMLTVPPALIFN